METTFNVECTVLGRLQSGTQTRDMVWMTPIPGQFQGIPSFRPLRGSNLLRVALQLCVIQTNNGMTLAQIMFFFKGMKLQPVKCSRPRMEHVYAVVAGDQDQSLNSF